MTTSCLDADDNNGATGKMECVWSGERLPLLRRALECAGRVKSSVQVIASPRGLEFSVLDDAQTSYLRICFPARSRAFVGFDCSRRIVVDMLVRPCLAALRATPKLAVEQLRIQLRTDRVQWVFVHKNGLRRNLWFSVADDKNGLSNEPACRKPMFGVSVSLTTQALHGALSNFDKKLEEIAISLALSVPAPSNEAARSSINLMVAPDDHVALELSSSDSYDNKSLHTSVKLARIDMIRVTARSDLLELQNIKDPRQHRDVLVGSAHIVVPVREIRAILQFCEAVKFPTLHILIDKIGDPIMFTTSLFDRDEFCNPAGTDRSPTIGADQDYLVDLIVAAEAPRCPSSQGSLEGEAIDMDQQRLNGIDANFSLASSVHIGTEPRDEPGSPPQVNEPIVEAERTIPTFAPKTLPAASSNASFTLATPSSVQIQSTMARTETLTYSREIPAGESEDESTNYMSHEDQDDDDAVLGTPERNEMEIGHEF